SATFTDSGIIASWPVSFGYSSTDTYAGTVDYLSITGPGSGTVNVTAPGSGTVTLPGSIVFNNCLQVKIENLSYANIGTFPLTFTINGVTTEYHYYTGTQKFPIVMVAYDSQTVNSGSGPTVQNSASITINNNVLTGINNINLEALNYNVYPNPTTNNVNINLTNEKTEAVSVVVINNLGQIVRSIDLGSAPEIKYLMNTSDLTSGIYHVKTTVGEKSTTKKLIIQ
ncbi:MAG TPA: T9SS type A sorting domain-containing protein, partial [Bacteroidia bacterium]|nr:T9SS type A sorting domain-containing protein [Bacteroidia bacterium]